MSGGRGFLWIFVGATVAGSHDDHHFQHLSPHVDLSGLVQNYLEMLF